MAAEWVPYVLIILVLVLISSCVYLWKHRGEMFEMTGIDPSTIPGGDKLKITKKKPKPIHPNAKKSIKYKPPEVIKQRMPQQPKEEKVIKRTPKPQEKKPKIITKNKRISDLQLSTNDSPIKAMQLNKEGFLVLVGKDKICRIYVSQFIDFTDMLTQVFELDTCDISHVGLFRGPNLKIGYIDQQHKKLMIASLNMSEESKFQITQRDEVPNVFKNTCQTMIIHPSGEYIALLTDQSTLRLYSVTGEVLFEQEFTGKRCPTMTQNDDYSRLFVAVGFSVYVFDWNSKKKALTQKCETNAKSTIYSLAYVPKTKELACLTDNALCVFPRKIESGKEKERWEMTGCRLIAASQVSSLVTIICGKSKMRLVDISSGKLLGELAEAHEGEINHVTWSLDDKWIFVASKGKPNVESFRYSDK